MYSNESYSESVFCIHYSTWYVIVPMKSSRFYSFQTIGKYLNNLLISKWAMALFWFQCDLRELVNYIQVHTHLRSVSLLSLSPCMAASANFNFKPLPSILISSSWTGSMDGTPSSGMPFVNRDRLFSICFLIQLPNSLSLKSHFFMKDAENK